MIEITVKDIISHEQLNLDYLLQNKVALITDEDLDIQYMMFFRYSKRDYTIIGDITECKKNEEGILSFRNLKKEDYPDWTKKFDTLVFDFSGLIEAFKERGIEL